LQAAYDAQRWKECTEILPSVKLQLIQAGTSGVSQQTALSLTRDMLEVAVELSVQLHDSAAVERNFQQLRALYMDTRSALPPSQNEPVITGLNLLRLLVQNRIAEFHTELEIMPLEAQQHPCVAYVIQLEQWLMEGAYNQVLAARGAAPSPSYNFFMQSLATTVRDEVAGCSELAYPSLTVSDAQSMLLMSSSAEASSFARERGWNVENERVVFQPHLVAAPDSMNAMDVITNSMTYARELERIV